MMQITPHLAHEDRQYNKNRQDMDPELTGVIKSGQL